MSKSRIEIYPKIDEMMKSSLNLIISKIEFKSKDEVQIGHSGDYPGPLLLGTSGNWQVENHPLSMRYVISFNPLVLKSIANHATLGLFLSWSSIDSHQTGQSKAIRILFDQNKQSFDFNLSFDRAQLKGLITLSFKVVILESHQNQLPAGYCFGEIADPFYVLVDPNVFSFPIIEVDDLSSNSGLWVFSMNTTDIEEDLFSEDHLSLKLNINHSLYPSLKNETGQMTPLYKEVLSNWFHMLILAIFKKSPDFIKKLKSRHQFKNNTIAWFVADFIYRYHININQDEMLQISIAKAINKVLG